MEFPEKNFQNLIFQVPTVVWSLYTNSIFCQDKVTDNSNYRENPDGHHGHHGLYGQHRRQDGVETICFS